jgi:transposase-like protein
MSKFGVDSARKGNTEVGAFVTAKFNASFTKWATYTSRIDLFSNYKRKPQNVDMLMTNLLTMKFTRVLATNISLDLIYDDDVKKRLQLKEILGIGLTVKL